MRHSSRFCPSGKDTVEGAREIVRTLAQLGQTGKEEEGGLVRWVGFLERVGGMYRGAFWWFAVRSWWLVGRREGGWMDDANKV